MTSLLSILLNCVISSTSLALLLCFVWEVVNIDATIATVSSNLNIERQISIHYLFYLLLVDFALAKYIKLVKYRWTFILLMSA